MRRYTCEGKTGRPASCKKSGADIHSITNIHVITSLGLGDSSKKRVVFYRGGIRKLNIYYLNNLGINRMIKQLF